jgi:hypothetical protein
MGLQHVIDLVVAVAAVVAVARARCLILHRYGIMSWTARGGGTKCVDWIGGQPQSTR